MEVDTTNSEWSLFKQGAEARLFTGTYLGLPTILKERFSKKYRHPSLDSSLTTKRTKSEVRTLMRCRMNGIATPAVYFVDLESHKIYMEHILNGVTVRDYIKQVQESYKDDYINKLIPLADNVGRVIGNMHQKGIIHGDLTTSNIMIRDPDTENQQLYIIDFGLSCQDLDKNGEHKGVDLYVMERALLSTHQNTEALFETLLKGYAQAYGKGAAKVLEKLDEVRKRGRKRDMTG